MRKYTFPKDVFVSYVTIEVKRMAFGGLIDEKKSSIVARDDRFVVDRFVSNRV
jgi:hypothetical protein